MGKGLEYLVKFFPVILSHQPEGREESPPEGIETSKAVVGITTETLEAGKIVRTGPCPAGVAAEHRVQFALHPVPVAGVEGELVPGLVESMLGPIRAQQLLSALFGKITHTLLSQYTHVDL